MEGELLHSWSEMVLCFIPFRKWLHTHKLFAAGEGINVNVQIIGCSFDNSFVSVLASGGGGALLLHIANSNDELGNFLINLFLASNAFFSCTSTSIGFGGGGAVAIIVISFVEILF